MNKNLLWKIALIAFLVVIAALELHPPQDTLKLGLDLAGGTSIVYDIDTHNLDSSAKRDLAERTIKVLRRRIDPSNMMNLEWIAQGNSRIEIKMPLASPESIAKREAYNNALEAINSKNINLAVVQRLLDEPADKRTEEFAKLAENFPQRLDALNQIGAIYDQLTVAKNIRDTAKKAMETSSALLKASNVAVEQVQMSAADWADLDDTAKNQAVETFLKGADPNTAVEAAKKQMVLEYIDIYKKWSDAVIKLTDADTGLNAAFDNAMAQLDDLNLDSVQVADVLDIDSADIRRTELINQMLEKFPDRTEQINAAVAAYDAYKPYRGRLDGPEDLKRMLKGAGVLEFRILAQYGSENISGAQIDAYRDNLAKKGPQAASDSRYIWCEIESIDDWKVPNSIVEQFGKKYFVLASNLANERMLANEQDKEWKLKSVLPTNDRMGRPAISFTFDAVAGNLFYKLTSSNLQRPLAILLDGIAISAPNINSAISTSGIIEGNFSLIEVQDMVSKLDAGSLKARLIEPPVSENTIGPGIGEDNRQKGLAAAMYGFVAVALFMIVYYIGSGFIAVIALLLNLLFILAIMAFSNATFTLPGIAGIILTIGMSVDANVLIFERIREELRAGSSLKIALQNGYQRAFRTILDANITTFITAAILYYVASEEIKGFAITLMLGIVSSLFTALFVTRVIFNLLTDAKILRNNLPMMQIFQKPAVPWMSLRPVFVIVSAALIICGMAIFFGRNDKVNSKYDIEFTGGTSVTISLKDDIEMSRDQVEAAIKNQGIAMNNPLLQMAKVYSVGESGQEYQISTIETNKVIVDVKFNQASAMTAEQIKAAITKSASKAGQGLDNLEVIQSKENPLAYQVTTSTLNQNLISEVLNNSFDPNNAVVSNVHVDEVVTDAIKKTFEDKLKVLENLNPQIVSAESIKVETIEKYPEISQYLGGVLIECKLENPVSAQEILQRFQTLRFKPDLAGLTKNPYKLFLSDYKELSTADGEIDSFLFAAVKADSLSPELSEQEFDSFASIEKQRVIAAGQLETSMSRVNQISPSIGRQAKTQAIIAIFLSLAAIIGYIWIRFGTARYGVAAIVALVHDVCITLGAVVACTYIAGTPLGEKLGIADFKINLETVAAILTIIGYSLNDTIIVFDRIRENKGKLTVLSSRLINDSINQTLSRTIMTSFTTFLVVFIMYVFGGAGLRSFTFAMLIGIVIGTYSSIAIAAPILIMGKKSQK